MCPQHGVKKAGGFACKYFWKAKAGSSSVVQLLGRSGQNKLALRLILDEPPERLYQKWIQDRMEYYLRVETVGVIRDEALDLDYPVKERLQLAELVFFSLFVELLRKICILVACILCLDCSICLLFFDFSWLRMPFRWLRLSALILLGSRAAFPHRALRHYRSRQKIASSQISLSNLHKLDCHVKKSYVCQVSCKCWTKM